MPPSNPYTQRPQSQRKSGSPPASQPTFQPAIVARATTRTSLVANIVTSTKAKQTRSVAPAERFAESSLTFGGTGTGVGAGLGIGGGMNILSDEPPARPAQAVGTFPSSLPFVKPTSSQLSLAYEESVYTCSADNATHLPTPVDALLTGPLYNTTGSTVLTGLSVYQFPSIMPQVERPVTDQSRAANEGTTKPSISQNPLTHLGDGQIGKLRVHRSGRATLELNNGIIMNVTRGTQMDISEMLYRISVEDGQAHAIGPVTARAVVSLNCLEDGDK
ncbi:RNA polymerase III RPC4 [Giardia muris]|uniref:RNA polymerase III RPC4 n=1 Tax=Giardia muris TaxID=5742 RepID=A0A4Z1T6T9_GIAMU|nr:RNA polymerase III RPC4 [Giardia muris]|eukprot:TNJ28847.1 RNA polymerase III RPC4 [Giardia muris]